MTLAGDRASVSMLGEEMFMVDTIVGEGPMNTEPNDPIVVVASDSHLGPDPEAMMPSRQSTLPSDCHARALREQVVC